MYLIQMLLPLADNEGLAFQAETFSAIQHDLTEKFGGITAFTRNPAEGRWQPDSKSIKHDDIIIFEVQAENLDESWWKNYRHSLEKIFRQEKLIVRAQAISLL